MEVGVYVHASAVLPTEISQNPLGRRLGGPRDGLDGMETRLLGTQDTHWHSG